MQVNVRMKAFKFVIMLGRVMFAAAVVMTTSLLRCGPDLISLHVVTVSAVVMHICNSLIFITVLVARACDQQDYSHRHRCNYNNYNNDCCQL